MNPIAIEFESLWDKALKGVNKNHPDLSEGEIELDFFEEVVTEYEKILEKRLK